MIANKQITEESQEKNKELENRGSGIFSSQAMIDSSPSFAFFSGQECIVNNGIFGTNAMMSSYKPVSGTGKK